MCGLPEEASQSAQSGEAPRTLSGFWSSPCLTSQTEVHPVMTTVTPRTGHYCTAPGPRRHPPGCFGSLFLVSGRLQ